MQQFIVTIWNRWNDGKSITVSATSEDAARTQGEKVFKDTGEWEQDCTCGSCDSANWVTVDAVE